MSDNKYELVKTDTVQSWDGRTLYRIKALREIVSLGIAVGALGGYIEKEANLAQTSGNAWIFGDAQIFGNAQIYGNARIFGDAQISGNAWIYGDARIYGDAQIYGNAWIFGDAWISGVNLIGTRSDGYTFLVAPTPEGPRIIAGCRYFTFKEGRAHWKATRGGTKLGDESLALVKHLETMAKLNGFMEPIKEQTHD